MKARFIHIWSRVRSRASLFASDTRAVAAIEFVFIVPLMLLLFFGTIEVSNAVAVYRKVTLMAHTLSDLTSQSISVQDADLTNFFAASAGVMTPYSTTPISQSITEIWVNPLLQARVQWSSGAGALAPGTVVTIPAAMASPNSYVIYSKVSYVYTPVVGYVLAKAGITMSDFAYTRPRQSFCVLYNTQIICPLN